MDGPIAVPRRRWEVLGALPAAAQVIRPCPTASACSWRATSPGTCTGTTWPSSWPAAGSTATAQGMTEGLSKTRVPVGRCSRSGTAPRRLIQISPVTMTLDTVTQYTHLWKKCKKGGQNPPWNLTSWCFKLAICLIFPSEIEFGSSRPSEIWQPWCANFGNPENQNSDLQVFEHP